MAQETTEMSQKTPWPGAAHMDKPLNIVRSELILGGQKSGKSRRAEALSRDWLDASPLRQAVLIATAQAWDAEMQARISQHQADRAERVPGMRTLEEPLSVAQAIASQSQADTLVVVDCLTLWLTNVMMPMHPQHPSQGRVDAVAPIGPAVAALVQAVSQAPGPVVLVGNEIGLGVIPMGAQVRAFVDALGLLNQSLASACARVTLMVAGLPLHLKDAA
jgi:adenosylcobinamide kinase/adenosylcobinamide-phosphate guanylyltransferase